MADVIAFPHATPDRQHHLSGARDAVAVLCAGDYDLADTFLQRLWFLGYRVEPIEPFYDDHRS